MGGRRQPRKREETAQSLRESFKESPEALYDDEGVTPAPSRKPRANTMNAPSEMSFEDMLRVKLEVLRREHRDLDEAIHALETNGRPDQLTLRRLKKQKLALKDTITRIEDQLIPDIIA